MSGVPFTHHVSETKSLSVTLSEQKLSRVCFGNSCGFDGSVGARGGVSLRHHCCGNHFALTSPSKDKKDFSRFLFFYFFPRTWKKGVRENPSLRVSRLIRIGTAPQRVSRYLFQSVFPSKLGSLPLHLSTRGISPKDFDKTLNDLLV